MRLVDIVGSISVLVFISPILLLVGVLMKLEAPGPAFCAWERVRAGGQRYLRLTFCPRSTWLSKMLRRFSMDELPRFIGVLLGEERLIELSALLTGRP